MRTTSTIVFGAFLTVGSAAAQTVTASAAAVSDLTDTVTAGSVQRSVSTPAGSSLTAGLSQSVGLPNPWGQGQLAQASTEVALAGTPASGWTLTLRELGSASLLGTGASSSSSTGPHTVLLRLVPTGPTVGEVVLDFDPQALAGGATGSASFDVDNDGTVELTASGSSPARLTLPRTLGAAGLVVAVTTSASLANVTTLQRYLLEASVTFQAASSCVATSLGAGSGGMSLELRETFSGDVSFRIRGAQPRSVTYLALGLSPTSTTIPLPPFAPQWIVPTVALPMLVDALGNGELASPIPLNRPWTIYAQAVSLDTSNVRVYASGGWSFGCP